MKLVKNAAVFLSTNAKITSEQNIAEPAKVLSLYVRSSGIDIRRSWLLTICSRC
ncbi:MAG: hypothetical protein KTR17_01975 [Cellvibrionaceae bacterium]|nr:hypothetical protein [Cellvibrionaceae bacterium]